MYEALPPLAGIEENKIHYMTQYVFGCLVRILLMSLLPQS